MAKKITLDSETERLYNETKKSVKLANQYINRIKRKYGEEDIYSIKKLRERLSTVKDKPYTIKGNISVRKDMSLSDLKKINKAVELYFKSKTSTLTGIKDAESNMIKGIQRITSTTIDGKTQEISKEDARALYDMFQDKRNFVPWSRKLGASDMWIAMQNAVDFKMNKDEFVELLESMTGGIDENYRKKAVAIYNKYVKDRVKKKK